MIMKTSKLIFVLVAAFSSRHGTHAFVTKPSPSFFGAQQRSAPQKDKWGSSSRLVTKAIVEHFEGNPVSLIAQVAAIGSVVTYGYVWSKNHHSTEESSPHLQPTAEKDFDVYRDSPLRYMGYANEVGEAFRPLVPVHFVLLSYLAALAYVFADGASKALAAPGRNCQNFGEGEDAGICAVPALTEVLSFQLLASVALPGFTINRWVLFLGLCAEEYDHLVAHLDPVILEWLPTLGGLALIPLIVRPLDFLVERALELILEPYLHKQFPRCTVTPQLE